MTNKTTLLSLFILTICSSNAQIDSTIFSKNVSFSTGNGVSQTQPHTIGWGDLNMDGRVDIVVPNSGENTISVFKNIHIKGNSFDTGSFSSKLEFTTLSTPLHSSVFDIDKDGKMDVAVGYYNATSVSVFPGTSSSGNITFGTRLDFAAGTNPSYIKFSDIDGDSLADMIVSNFGGGNISVFRNTSTTGNISFSSRMNFSVTSGPAFLVTGDINGDSKNDIIVSCYNSNKFCVLINNSSLGNISLNPSVGFSTGSLPNGIDISDINKDGKPDIAITNNNSGSISIYQNTSSSSSVSFRSPITFATGSGPQHIAFADIDKDSIKDICVTNRTSNTLSILKVKNVMGNIDSSSFYPKIDFIITGGPLSVATTDIDNNGSIDLILTNYASGKINVMVNKNTYLTMGISEKYTENKEEANFYPMPVLDMLHIDNLENVIHSITVFDMLGKDIFHKTFNSKNIDLDMSSYPTGYYNIVLHLGNGISRRKIFKQ